MREKREKENKKIFLIIVKLLVPRAKFNNILFSKKKERKIKRKKIKRGKEKKKEQKEERKNKKLQC